MIAPESPPGLVLCSALMQYRVDNLSVSFSHLCGNIDKQCLVAICRRNEQLLCLFNL